MYDFIFILGAQGVGKTTVSRLLKEKLHTPNIEFDLIRGMHLDKEWTDMSDAEENMSLENMTFLLNNYAKYNYTNIIVSGFTENQIERILDACKEYKVLVVTLYLTDDEPLKRRVLTDSRDSGFRDFEASITFNKKLRHDLHFPNEHKIDTTNQTAEETVAHIETILKE